MQKTPKNFGGRPAGAPHADALVIALFQSRAFARSADPHSPLGATNAAQAEAVAERVKGPQESADMPPGHPRARHRSAVEALAGADALFGPLAQKKDQPAILDWMDTGSEWDPLGPGTGGWRA